MKAMVKARAPKKAKLPASIHQVPLGNAMPEYGELLRAVVAVCRASGEWSDRPRRKAIRECWRALGASVPVTICIPYELQHFDEKNTWIRLPVKLVKEIRPHAPDGKEEGTKQIHKFITGLVRREWSREKLEGGAK